MKFLVFSVFITFISNQTITFYKKLNNILQFLIQVITLISNQLFITIQTFYIIKIVSNVFHSIALKLSNNSFQMKATGQFLANKINGLYYYQNFVSYEEKNLILNIINNKQWCSQLRRRQQYYGIKYFQTKYQDKVLQNKESIQKQNHEKLSHFQFLIDKMISVGIFSKQNPPNQCLVNRYLRKDYLGLHVQDKNCYGPIIAGLSLGSVDYLRLNKQQKQDYQKNDENNYYMKLEDKSLYVLTNQARQQYKHGIGRSIEGINYKQQSFQRISLTFRHVIDTRRKL